MNKKKNNTNYIIWSGIYVYCTSLNFYLRDIRIRFEIMSLHLQLILIIVYIN